MLDIKNLKVDLENKILQSDKVIIMPHMRADFDAFASSVGMSLISNKLKKESHILLGDPSFSLCRGMQQMIDDVKDDFSIISVDQYEKMKNDKTFNVLCDVNTPKLTYIKDFEKDKLAIIDHHNRNNDTFDAGITHIDTEASSASEIITALLREYYYKWEIQDQHNKTVKEKILKIPSKIATLLLTGIRLDTFKLCRNTYGDTHLMLAQLAKSGSNLEASNNYLNRTKEEEKKVQEIVAKAETQGAIINISVCDKAKVNTQETIAQACDELQQFGDAAFVIGKTKDCISISARSNGSFNVGAVMSALGGGGNQYSGAAKIFNSTLEDVAAKVKQLVFPFTEKKCISKS